MTAKIVSVEIQSPVVYDRFTVFATDSVGSRYVFTMGLPDAQSAASFAASKLGCLTVQLPWQDWHFVPTDTTPSDPYIER